MTQMVVFCLCILDAKSYKLDGSGPNQKALGNPYKNRILGRLLAGR